MTIVHLISSLGVGGLERFALGLARLQLQRGHRVQVIALRGGPLLKEATELAVPTAVLSGGRVRRVLNALQMARRLKADIVHAHNPTTLHYAAWCGTFTSAHVLMTDHGQGLGSPRTPAAWECRKVETVVAVSRYTAGRPTAQALASKTVVVYNGVAPVPELSEAEKRSARSGFGVDGRFVGLVLASLTPVKGHPTLLSAAAKLQAAGTPLTLLIAGEGARRQALEAQVESLGLTQSVHFLGFRSDLRNLMAASDFMVLPSLNEGFPLSVIEAMAYGVPVVASRVGGIPEVVVHERTGLLAEPEDPDDLMAAIQRLHRDAPLRETLARQARAMVEDQLTSEMMCTRYEDIYRRLVEN